MDGTGESLPRAPIPAWREHTNGRSRNAWRAHKKDSVAGGHRMNAQDCSGRVEMEGGAIRAIDTRRMGFPSDFCCHAVSSMQPLYGVAGSCICYNAKDGSARRQSTTRSFRKGVETEAPLRRRRLNKKPSHEASVPGRRDSAHTPPRDSHWPRTSRAHQGIEAVAAAASSLRPPPALHLVRHAGSPEACEPQEASSTATLGRRCSLPRRAVCWHGRHESKAGDLAFTRGSV
ncbi:hypothetical protein TASIC1_0010015400 [Trichoderma asperellum]|uniref:Uncharacterized protein n=1 Tax=Trichoderma asperellum TaxID=101201 RepID=A0A6V8R6U3_TRIAP|nr:hypothetical protein TASIC1_0010015400 [Trichoderma asperellum]